MKSVKTNKRIRRLRAVPSWLLLTIALLAWHADAFGGRLNPEYSTELKNAAFNLEASTGRFENWKVKTKAGHIGVQIRFNGDRTLNLLTISLYSHPLHDGFSIGKSIFYPEPSGADSLQRKIIEHSTIFFQDSSVNKALHILFGKVTADIKKAHSEEMSKGAAKKRSVEIRKQKEVVDGYVITKCTIGSEYQMVFAVGDANSDLQFSPLLEQKKRAPWRE